MGVTIGGLFWALLLSSTCLRCVLLDVYSTESETLSLCGQHSRLARHFRVIIKNRVLHILNPALL